MNPNASYTVAVKDHFMIAHSLKGAVFGPAQGLHGATYHVVAEFSAEDVDAHGIVLDIGLAGDCLRACVDPLRMQNLDTLPAFDGRNTTTEFLCRYLHEALSERVRDFFSGHLRVVLEESAHAWAAYAAPVKGSSGT